MSRIAILAPTTLLGREVRETLERQPGAEHELVLLATEAAEVGAVTEAYGAAALVARAEPEALSDVDLIFVCGDVASARALLAGREPGTTALVLSPEASERDGRAIVAGVNDATACPGELLRSPHPAAVALAHVTLPLLPLGLEEIHATVVQPASLHGQEALEDLFNQTRNIIAMTSSQPSRWDRQLAFNLFPALDVTAGAIDAVLAELGLPATLKTATEVLQGPLFHGVAASVFARFPSAGGVDAAAVERALVASPRLEIDRDAADRPGLPGPVEAANEERILVGGVRAVPSAPGVVAIWAVMDNLTLGSARNAVDVAMRVLNLPRA